VLYINQDCNAPEGSLKKWAFENDDFLEIFGRSSFIVNGVIFIVFLFTIFGINAEFDKTINEYNATKILIESYQGGDYGNAPALTEKVIELNDEISKHKAKCHNPWFNVWNSEEVGNLEPLTFSNK